MMTIALLTLVFLQIKHWFVDFVIQTPAEIEYKGIYGHWYGIMHSAKHGIGTAIAVGLTCGPNHWPASVLLGVIDGLVHYHVDWIKKNLGVSDVKNPVFWAHLGLDQLVHQLTYIGIVATIVL